MSSLDYLDLCRLCLVKDRVSVPIFEGEGDVRQIFLKIAACLPVKVAREDKLPKKICDDCVYKVELLYQFWNTTASAEKQLLQWLGDVSLDDKQGYVTGAHNQSLMKPGQNPVENRLDGSVMQQVNDHPNNMGMGMMDSMGMGMPMMITTSGQQQQSQQQQQMTSVPMDTGGNSVQNVQAVPGPSTQSTHEQIAQQKAINPSSNQDDDEDESEEDDNSDDECDGDDGLPVKEESEEDPNSSRTIEPTTFVNVSLACDEAGPSGLQQQKIGEMPEMVMPTADGDPKSGILCRDSQLAVGKLVVRRSQRLKSKVSEDSTICTTIKEEITKDENVDVPSGNPFLEVRIKREDDIVSIAGEGEELVHLNNEDDEEEVYGDYSCQKCNICFTTWDMLKIHMKCVHEARQCFKCKICSKVYNNVEAFQLHVTSDYGRDNDAVNKCLGTLTSSVADNPEMSYSLCDYKTKNKTSLAKHVSKHVEKSRFSCDKCGRKFKIRRNLIYHIRFSHREQSCICDVCGETFANNRSLDTHRKFVHFEGKFQCKLCNRLLISQENLDTHVLRQHVQRKPAKAKPLQKKFVCETCGKVFTRVDKLKRHNLVHAGEKPFVCETCGKAFKKVDKLKRHHLVHTGEKPFVCKTCGKAFTCVDKLKRHNLVHTGEKPFVCAICKETFARKNSLTQHLLLHTGAKPYVCDICGKAFAQKPGLTGHRRSHPGHHPPLPPVFVGPIIEDILKQCEQ